MLQGLQRVSVLLVLVALACKFGDDSEMNETQGIQDTGVTQEMREAPEAQLAEPSDDWAKRCSGKINRACTKIYRPSTCSLGELSVEGSNSCVAKVKLLQLICDEEAFEKAFSEIECTNERS